MRCAVDSTRSCAAAISLPETGEADDELSALLDESGLEKILPRIAAPTLIIQGEDDTLFLSTRPTQTSEVCPGAPATMKWVAGGHDAEISVDPLIDDLEEWFGRYLKRDGSAPTPRFRSLCRRHRCWARIVAPATRRRFLLSRTRAAGPIWRISG